MQLLLPAIAVATATNLAAATQLFAKAFKLPHCYTMAKLPWIPLLHA